MSDHESARALERWLRYARDDLRSAEILLVERRVPRNSCFLAQQAAEKSIKAIFVALQTDFPFTHDLNRLLDLLPEDWEMKKKLPDLTDLSDRAVEPRCPGDMPEADENDTRIAVRQAREVYGRPFPNSRLAATRAATGGEGERFDACCRIEFVEHEVREDG